MTKLTRRAFLTQNGMIAVGFGILSSSSFLLRAAESESSSNRDTVLVFVLLRGGADGLNICAPYGDPEYYKARPSVALPKPRTAGASSLVDLDGYFGLHPAFAGLKGAWSDGQLAVLHAVGSRAMTRSHFDAQEFLETGTPGIRGTSSGWMDRCLARIPGSELTQGVSFSPLLPRAFLGKEPVLVTEDLGQFELRADGWKSEAEALIREMYSRGGDAVIDAGRNAFQTLDVIRRSPAVGARPSNGAQYPVTHFGQAMRQSAQVIKAGLGTRCIFVNFESQFDTHSNQLASNEVDFANLGQSLAGFHRDLGKEIDRVVVVVASEFGRTVAEDGSKGTDHGTGGTMLILGGPVRGGRVAGKWPGIEKNKLFEERDLDVTTDFRDVFIEIAGRHLGLDHAETLFPGYTPGHLPAIIA
jgi:uncharacterized protein (DUF1501 family)